MFGKFKNRVHGREKSLKIAEKMDGQKEIGFNVWFIIDQATNVCYYYIIKPYCISGSEEKKLETLNELSKYDFMTSTRKKLPEDCVIVVGNEKYTGCLLSYNVDDFFVHNFDYFVTEVEKNLPPVIKFNPVTGDHRAIAQKMIDAPLYVRTFILEDDYGNLTPKISDIKKEIYQ